MTQTDREAILANWNAQLAAMDAADTAALKAQFTPEATLVHLTGFVSNLDEWLDGLRDGTFVYHRVVPKDVHVTVEDGDQARLVGRITTGVTDDGSGHPWRLRIAQDFERTNRGWLVADSRTTTW